jgi:NADPH:quinone reductase-like Zn-dependent oxidoreductase
MFFIIKVEASSINLLDYLMTQGYGRTLLNEVRSKTGHVPTQGTGDYLPLTLGRDFSGTVVDVGLGPKTDYKAGDQVWGAVAPSSQGSHAEYVVASTISVSSPFDQTLEDLRSLI